MDDSDLLLSLAEIAVALAGFSGLATILGHSSAGRIDPAQAAALLESVLMTALLAATFSLLPFLPARLGASDALTWRLSAGAFALVWGVYAAITTRRFFLRFGSSQTRWLAYLRIALASVAILSLLPVALGFFPISAPGIYLFALFVLLFQSANVFVHLFRLLLPPWR